MVRVIDVADRHRGDADLVADFVGERGLPHAAVHGLLPGDCLSGRDVDEIDTCVLEGARDG